MSQGQRARADELARRVNDAAEFLAEGRSVPESIQSLAQRHSISPRQARRYVVRAQDSGAVEVPGPKQVFTVKLPQSLVRRLREYAQVRRTTLSALVARALEEFLGTESASREDGQ